MICSGLQGMTDSNHGEGGVDEMDSTLTDVPSSPDELRHRFDNDPEVKPGGGLGECLLPDVRVIVRYVPCKHDHQPSAARLRGQGTLLGQQLSRKHIQARCIVWSGCNISGGIIDCAQSAASQWTLAACDRVLATSTNREVHATALAFRGFAYNQLERWEVSTMFHAR